MTLTIGFGTSDITPPLGTELAGFGPFLQRRATSVAEPLRARAMAVDHESGRWVLIACDLLAVDAVIAADVRARVAEASRWPPEVVVVHATHTHSGPCATPGFIGWGEPDPYYLAQLPGQIAAAALEAVNTRRPATVAIGHAPLERFAYNRMRPSPGRTNSAGLSGSWHTSEPERIDDGVDVIRIDVDGGLTGIVARYSCHPVVCCEETNAIHGDFPAMAIRRLEAAHPGATGIFVQGALGDINPTYAHGPPDESMVALEHYGARFAVAAEHALSAAAPIEVAAVGAARADLDYELGPINRAFLADRLDRARRLLAAVPPDDTAEPTRMARVYERSLRQSLARLDAGLDVRAVVPVVALRLGELLLAGAGMELFHGVHRGVRAVTDRQVWVLSTTDGYAGYCPTADAFDPEADPYPAYEVPYFNGQLPFAPDIADRTIAALVALLAEVEPKMPTFGTTSSPTRHIGGDLER